MKVFTILLFLYFPLSVSSQTSDSSKSIYAGSVSLSGFYQSGNTNKFYVSSTGDVKRSSETLETILAATFGYGENRMRKDDNVLSSVLTIDLFYKNRISPFLLQIYEYNFAKGIDVRSQSGGGVKYVLIPEAKHKSSVSLALIYDYTNLANHPGNYDVDVMRLSWRLKTRQEIFDSHLIFSGIGFFQPALNDFSKRNIRIETSLSIPITKIIFANINYLYSFDDIVSLNRKRADNKLTFGFRVGFGE
ncbi:MAG: DUF481 domain-containing protein [Ignavibacteria bacterium]